MGWFKRKTTDQDRQDAETAENTSSADTPAGGESVPQSRSSESGSNATGSSASGPGSQPSGTPEAPSPAGAAGTGQTEPSAATSAGHAATEQPGAGQAPGHGGTPAGSTGVDDVVLESKVIEVLRGCYDPEIPVNIHELGLIYEVKVKPGNDIYIKMTLTSPMCPVAGSLPPEIEQKVKGIPEVKEATVEVVWDPPWTPEMMTEAAKLQLGMM